VNGRASSNERARVAARVEPHRHQPPRARPARSRRGRASWPAAVVVVALLVAAGTTLLIARTPARHHANPARGTSSAPTTTTTAPAPPPPTSFQVGIRTVTWVEPTGVAVNPATHQSSPRTLVTEIRYPTLAGANGTETSNAPPSIRYGPYPVVVFAHGFNTDPSTYKVLLDSWVSAGFVVVAPVFPEENAATITSLGGPDSYLGDMAEGDLPNEPGDLAFVVSQVLAWSQGSPPANTGPSADASFLRGLANPSDLALAGQSDGGDAVAGLVFGAHYQGMYGAMPVHPRAVLVLSGAEIPGIPSTYGSPTPAPDTLVVQSATDQCNLPQESTILYNTLAGPKWFLELDNATHLGPYVGNSPAAPVVQRVTTDFIDMALGRGSASPSTLAADVAGSTVASLSSGAAAPPITPLQEPSPSAVVQACAP
jgi:hypothetical protein